MRKILLAIGILFGSLFAPAAMASASTSYSVNYHGAYVSPWVWSGNGAYLQSMYFIIKDVTNSRICPTYGVEGQGFLWKYTSCENPGQVMSHTWTWNNYVRYGTYNMFISMPGWPTLYHAFSVT